MHTMHPDFLTILLMNTPDCLVHGSIFPDVPLREAAAEMRTDVLAVRMIHYPMRNIDTLLYALRDNPTGLRELLVALEAQGTESAGLADRLRVAIQ